MDDHIRSSARLPLELPVQLSWKGPARTIRQSGGRTRNISGSGVLIKLRPRIPLETSVKFRILFPPRIAKSGFELIGEGRVVRRVGSGGMGSVAVIIDDYQLRPARSGKGSHSRKQSPSTRA